MNVGVDSVTAQTLIPRHKLFETTEPELVATLPLLIALIIAYIQIFIHKRWRNKPLQQRHVTTILFIVPIYGCYSWILLNYFNVHSHYEYFFAVKDFYAAYVIYSFLCLCHECLIEVNTENQLRNHIELPRNMKRITQQFCVVNPISAVVIVILKSRGLYRECDWSDNGYVCVSVVRGFSVTLALYGLFGLLKATRDQLTINPVFKFGTVAFIVFLPFWQELTLGLLEQTDVITPITTLDGSPGSGKAATAYSNLLICFETLAAAIALRFAFPLAEYAHVDDDLIMTTPSKEH